jgi:CheY-like chemotaxis protein
VSTDLLVEYDESMRSYLKGKLEKQGYAVITVMDRFQAIEVLRGIHVDVITPEMKMPGIDGLDSLNEVGETSEKISVDPFMKSSRDTSALKKAVVDILSSPPLELPPNRASAAPVVRPESPGAPSSVF